MSKKKDIENAEAKLAAEVNAKIAAEQEKLAQDAPGEATGPETPGDTGAPPETQPAPEEIDSLVPEIEILPVVRGTLQGWQHTDKFIKVTINVKDTHDNGLELVDMRVGAIVDIRQVHIEIPKPEEVLVPAENPNQMALPLDDTQPEGKSCDNCGWFNDDIQGCVEPEPKPGEESCSEKAEAFTNWIPRDPDTAPQPEGEGTTE